MSGNPIQYTSRTFNTILADINADSELADKPNWFKRLIAGIGDVISMWNNATANNLLLRTAFTRRVVADLLALIDYQLSPQSTASGDILFYLKDSVVLPITVNRDDLVALTTGSIAVSSKRFEARGNVNVSSVTETFANTAINTSTEEITVAREFTTGERVKWSTTGTLPTGISASVFYYAIKVDATTIKIATSLVNAYAGTAVDFTDQGTGNHTLTLFSFTATVYQQELKENITIGTSDGTTEFQEFDLPDNDILRDTLEIEINSQSWTRVETLVDSISTDRHFKLIYNSDNSSKIQFGDGTYGQIPPAFDIVADYAIGGNDESNVTAVNNINIYGGADSNIDGVSNYESITGGADPQSIENGKILGPLTLKARGRFVTTQDGEALALAFGGISQASVIKNAFGVLSAKVVTIANGGGNPDTATKNALQQYLIDRTLLEEVDVQVLDTTITATNVTSAGKVLSGYVWSGGVEPFFTLAWRLALTETGQQIKDTYDGSGIASAVTLINTIFSTSFTSSDHSNIVPLLENLNPRQIGEDVQESDVVGYIDSNVVGLDYLTITVPSFPISLADDEITTVGTLTLTEIP